ncbi:serine hydrolase domain-containing protein [Streptomyces sp. NPDC001922]|uniref:serine hydrolase domain-containing protein n=1 Tax=Streptomyces sp. NPDC001922 TaxID=3364624 RepID=UPI0036B0B223
MMGPPDERPGMAQRTARTPVVAAVLAALLAGGCAPQERPASAPARPGVSAAVRGLVTEGDAPGAAALARDGRRTWFGTAGVADVRSKRRIRPDDRFRAGSVTKTFVATVTLQLAAEQRLRLDDTVERHLPGLVRGNGNDGRRITVRQLLDHTSGLFDYTGDRELRDQSFGRGLPVHRAGSRTPRQLVRVALRHPPRFRPGTGYRYSNTDYILLGLIVRQVTGHPYPAEIRRRILRPLRLSGTSFPGTREGLPAPHGRAYSTRPPGPGGHRRKRVDVTALDPSSAGAAGEMVSTLDDLGRFLQALLSGRLLPAAQLERMRDTAGTHGKYGLGLFPVRLPCGRTLWGHNGVINGSYVLVVGTADGRRVFGYRVNSDVMRDRQAEPRLLAAEFCRRSPAPRS